MLTYLHKTWLSLCKCHNTVLYGSCIDEEEKRKLREKLLIIDSKLT